MLHPEAMWDKVPALKKTVRLDNRAKARRERADHQEMAEFESTTDVEGGEIQEWWPGDQRRAGFGLLRHREAFWDARETAGKIVGLMGHGGSSHSIRALHAWILHVWKGVQKTIDDAPVAVVRSKAADPPSKDSQLCLLNDRCLCSEVGPEIVGVLSRYCRV